MKRILTLVLLLAAASVSAQVEVVNADSIRLNNAAGTGNTSIYGKLTLKNIAIGNTNDSVLVIAANGRIKFIPRSTITTTGNYVQNQNSTDQSANFRITGRGQFGNRLGLGSAALNSGIVNFYNTLPVTGGATAYSNLTIADVNSDVTTSARIYQSVIGTQAASFTLPSIYHFYARQGTIGSGSAVTNQYGFAVDNTLTGATNNYGFRGAIAAGTNRWNIYMDGTADNYIAGNLGIGTTSLSQYSLHVGKPLTGGTSSFGVVSDGLVQADATTTGNYFTTSARTQATSFTVGSIHHFNAGQGTFGAGSTVTNQNGFLASSSLTGATNNYGFRGLIAADTGRWNIFMDGTADNYLAGNLGIGITVPGVPFHIAALNGNVTRTIGGAQPGMISLYNKSSDINTGPEILFGAYYSGTAGYPMGSIGFKRLYGAGTGGSTVASYFTINTSLNTSNYNIERLRVTAEGNVAIGSTTASGALHVVRATDVQSLVQNSAGKYISTIAGGSNAGHMFDNTASFRIWSQDPASIGTTNNITTRFTIDGSTGNTGIGTSTPAEALDIVGKARVSVAPTNATDVVRLTDLTGTINTNAIQNQTSSAQAASFRVSGSGQVGIFGVNSTPAANVGIYNRYNLTGATAAYGEYSNNVVQSDVTLNAYGKRVLIGTAAAAFTLGSLYYYRADQGTFGAGSTVTSQTGFYVSSSLSGATNNYAFRSTVGAGANNWNLYMEGTANNYINGNVGIGSSALTAYNLRVARPVTGATSAFGITSDGIIQSDVTAVGAYFNTRASTQAASFTLNTLIHYRAVENTIGSGSTVTNQYGFSVDASLTGATNNYGYYGGIAASSNRWNLYMGGTANNYLAGNLGIGTNAPSAKLHLAAGGTAAGSGQLKLTSGSLLTTPENGAMEYDGTNLYFTPSATTRKTIAYTASPAFTGTPTSPTATTGTNTTQVATTAFVQQEIANKMTYGSSLLVFNGVTTVFNITHGLGSDPASIMLTFEDTTNTAVTQCVRTKNSTHITITYAVAPPAGTATIYWQAYK